MSILINQHTKVIIQGITGQQASFHLPHILECGTNVVAGISKREGETSHLGIPIYTSVQNAVNETGAEASLVFVGAKNVRTAVQEALEAGIKFIVSVAQGVPILDVIEIQNLIRKHHALFIGPNTPGIITPNEACLGIFPQNMLQKGRIGIISRSSTLTYEAILETNKAGLGQSTVLGLGDDMIAGTSFEKPISLFMQDEQTDAVVLIGALGGTYEENAANYYQNLQNKKPLIVYITGIESLIDDMGYASDILTHGKRSIEDKKQAFAKAGAIVIERIDDLHTALQKL